MTWSNVPVPDTICVPLLVGIVGEVFWPMSAITPTSSSIVLGIALLTLSIALIYACVEAAGDHTINSPGTLITSGPYSRSRNPMYVSWFLVVAAVLCFTGSIWFVAGLAVAVPLTHFAAILPEEAFLEGKFGDEFSSYREDVRRYL